QQQQQPMPLQQQVPGLTQLPGSPNLLPNQQINVAGVNNTGTSTTGTVSRFRAVELSQEEREKRKKLVNLIRSRNPYRLSSDGVLLLPGFAGIPLAGLSE